jgi:hypothetical protein
MKYIVFDNKTKRVVLPPSDKPYTDLTKYVTQCEVESIPSEYDFLEVTNVQEHIRVIKEAYTEEVIEWNEETKQEETKLVEHPQITETYYDCDLIAKFREYTAEQLEKQKEKRYHDLTEKYIRQKYSQGDMEAVINNYLEYKETYENENALIEYNKMQAYRKECKVKAYKEVYGVAK